MGNVYVYVLVYGHLILKNNIKRNAFAVTHISSKTGIRFNGFTHNINLFCHFSILLLCPLLIIIGELILKA